MSQDDVLLFRSLTDQEDAEFRAWARQNYRVGDPINALWHPVIRNECAWMCDEAYAAVIDPHALVAGDRFENALGAVYRFVRILPDPHPEFERYVFVNEYSDQKIAVPFCEMLTYLPTLKPLPRKDV